MTRTKQIKSTIILSFLIFSSFLSIWAMNIGNNVTDNDGREEDSNNVREKTDIKSIDSLSSASPSIEWWNNNWQYRVPINLTLTGSENLTDYQIKIDIELADWYNAGYVDGTGKDIRFTDSSSQILNFWIENMTTLDGENSTIWVKVPEIGIEGDNTIVMYFGNPDATSMSNGTATFPLFEDFENYGSQSDNTLPSNWIDYASGDVRLDADDTEGTRVLLKDTNNDPNGGYRVFDESVSDFEVSFKTNRINNNGGSQNRYAIEDSNFDGYGPRVTTFGTSSTFAIEERTSGSSQGDNAATSVNLDFNTWYTIVYRKYDSNIEAEVYNKTGDLEGSVSGQDTTHAGPFDRFVVHGGNEFWTDDIIIRKYTPDTPEVTVGTIEFSEFRITCLDIDGQRVEGAEIQVTNASSSFEKIGTTNANGEVVFENVPTGIYNITVNYTLDDGFNSITETVYYLEEYSKLEQELDIYVNLWIIDFEVQDADGDPLDYGYVNVSAEGSNNVLHQIDLDSNGEGRLVWNSSKEFYNYSVYFYNPDYTPVTTFLNSGTIYRNETSKTYLVNETAELSSGFDYYVEDNNIYLYDDLGYNGPDEIVEIRFECSDMDDNLTDITIRYSGVNHITEYTDETSATLTYKPLEEGLSIYQVQRLRVNFENATQSNGTIQLDLTKTYIQEITVNMSKLSLRVLDSEQLDGVAGLDLKVQYNGTTIDLANLETDSEGYAYGDFTNDFSFWYLNNTAYNFSLSFQGAPQLFNVVNSKQSQPENTNWYNYTLEEFDTLEFSLANINYSKRLANFSDTQLPNSEVTWGENIIFSVVYNTSDDGGLTWRNDYSQNGIDTYVTFELFRGATKLLEESMTPIDKGSEETGNFTIEIDTGEYSAGGNGRDYYARITGQKSLWSNPEAIDFEFKINPVTADVKLYDYDSLETTNTFSVDYGESINITLSYNTSLTAKTPETLEYSWMPVDSELDGSLATGEIKQLQGYYYYFEIDASLVEKIGTFSIDITATLENYTTDIRVFLLEVINRRTLINGSESFIIAAKNVWINDAYNFTFEYADSSTNDRVDGADVKSYYWYKVDQDGNPLSGSSNQGDGFLTEDDNDLYILDFETQTRTVGDYRIIATIFKDNYEEKNILVDLSIKKREITAELSANIDISDKIIEVVKGDEINFELELKDPTQGDIPLEGADVTLSIGDKSFDFEEQEDGTYTLTLSTEEYEAFFAGQTLSGTITIEKEDYTTQTLDVTVVINMEEIFEGVPTFYFFMIVGAIAAVVGTLVGYRAYHLAKIPKFVKNVRKMQDQVKGGKKIPESLLYPSKAELTVEMYEDKWRDLGLSLADIMGIDRSKKGKKMPDVKDKQSGGES